MRPWRKFVTAGGRLCLAALADPGTATFTSKHKRRRRQQHCQQLRPQWLTQAAQGYLGQELKWWRQPLRCWKEWWDLKNHVSHFRACKCMGKNCSCLSQNTKRDLHVQTADKPRPPARKLSAIAHKLWQVLRVNKLLLAVAILTMVTSSLLPLQLVPLTGTKCTMPH